MHGGNVFDIFIDDELFEASPHSLANLRQLGKEHTARKPPTPMALAHEAESKRRDRDLRTAMKVGHQAMQIAGPRLDQAL